MECIRYLEVESEERANLLSHYAWKLARCSEHTGDDDVTRQIGCAVEHKDGGRWAWEFCTRTFYCDPLCDNTLFDQLIQEGVGLGYYPESEIQAVRDRIDAIKGTTGCIISILPSFYLQRVMTYDEAVADGWFDAVD